MPAISLSLNEEQIHALLSRFPASAFTETGPYMRSRVKAEGCVITVYTSGKAVFQGPRADEYARPFRTVPFFTEDEAGSDEVGTGDYFGPIAVCAVLARENDAKFLKDIAAHDSKQISDTVIRETVPKILARVPYSLCLLSPEKYNEVQPSNNMNRIKARLHNMCYRNLKKKYGPLPGKIVIDQFTPEHLYYRYLEGEPEIIRGITFETKAEDKYLSVGAASMIARFAFLQAMDRMSETYGTEFPKGAGAAVDEFAADFVKKYGKDELRKTAKLNFANTKKLPE